MDKEHTKGPWVVDPDDKTTILSKDPPLEIASVFTDEGPYEADAILIAASPELLSVCELALSLSRTGECVDALILEHAIDNARGRLK